MNEVNSPLTTPPLPSSASPPPKCAICLGTFTNKCFSDSCMHQFCFTCLLEWSKVKPECPLCKQPFKRIIHNIKSNDDYEEHIVAPNVPERVEFTDNDNFMYLRATPHRHFQFRTTFTVDPGGELAIQQMLLSHPLTNTLYNMNGGSFFPTANSTSRFGRLRQTRRASSATSFRRSIYNLNMWVYPESVGPYRDIHPSFYRDNPASRNRLVPWLNRELNALLRENTQQVMHLVDVIMDHLARWDIRSRAFKNLLSPYLSTKTNHFIHEFFNFMRSPYDMIAYDRHIVYADRPQSPPYLISDIEEDSDVTIVNISEPVAVDNNPFHRPTIEVIEINSDSSHESDVIIGETPAPEIVNLVDSDSTDTPVVKTCPVDSDGSEGNRSPILPLKIRLKRKRQSREKRSNKKFCSKRHYFSSTTQSSSDSSSTDSSDSSDCNRTPPVYKRKRKHMYKIVKPRISKNRKSNDKPRYKNKSCTLLQESSSSSIEMGNNLMFRSNDKGKHRNNSSTLLQESSSSSIEIGNNFMFDSEDNLPLSKFKCKELNKRSESNQKLGASTSKSHTVTSKILSNTNVTSSATQYDNDCVPSCSSWNTADDRLRSNREANNSLSYSHINMPVASSNLPGINNEYNMNMPYSMSNCPYGEENNMFDMVYASLPKYNTPQIGNRYYDGPDYTLPRSVDSYTPPLPTTVSNALRVSNGEYFANSHGLYSNYPWKMEIPPHVKVDVGTSPIKTEFTKSEYNCCPASNSNSATSSSTNSNRRLQSVIVKKENPNQHDYLVCSDSSDS